ncbi:MAG: hypothetical protein ABJD57_03795, partial [Roseibium sp.]
MNIRSIVARGSSKPALISFAAFGLGAFHLAVVSGIFSLSTMPMRLIHVALAFSLLFVLKPASARLAGSRLNGLLTWGLVLAVVGASLWLIARWKAIAFSGGLTEPAD